MLPQCACLARAVGLRRLRTTAFFAGACAQGVRNDVNAVVGEMGGWAEGHEACSGMGMGLQRLHHTRSV